jgi:hypothetical protein
MAASYPTSVRTFTNKVDIVDTIFADHVNVIQDELRATQSSLGTTLLGSTYTGTFAQTTTWLSLSSRLSNIEAGLVSGVVGSPYFKKSGDNISPASGSVGLTLKTTAGSTNLLEARNAANTLRFNVDYDGLPKVGTAPVVYVGSSEYNTITSNLTTTTAVANANPFNAFLLAGM